VTYEQLKSNEEQLVTLSNTLTEQVVALASKSREIERLNSKARDIQEQLGRTKSRIEELVTERDKKAGRLTPISAPVVPFAPDRDRRMKLGAVGSVGMAGVGVAFVVMLGFFDRRLRHVDRARSYLPQVGRVLGVLPDLPTDSADSSEAAESAFCVHHIRSMVQIHQRFNGRKVFAITSPSPGDGKTSLTIALAMSMASSGSNTLVVDCDFDGGGLTSRLRAISEPCPLSNQDAYDRMPGLVDVIRGMPVEHAIASTGFPNLSKLTLGAGPGAYSGQVSPGQLRRLLSPLVAKFDIVLVDCGPILGSIEAAIAAAEVDSVILVVSRDSDRVAAQHAADLLISAGSAIEGIVFNRARPSDVAKSSYHASTSTRLTSSPYRRPIDSPARNVGITQ
jgi:Mrp family chromosome partitioning ATPase